MNSPIKVFIADDHDLIRRGISNLLNDNSLYTITGEAKTLKEVAASEALCSSDVLILDISFNDGSGLDILPDILDKTEGLRILIVSMFDKPLFIKRAVNCGARGYVLKSSPFSTLTEALDVICSGGIFLDPALSDSLFSLLQDDESASEQESLYSSLSNREQQIFRMLAENLSPGKIGKELGISAKTVENHRSHIITKLKLTSPVDIIPLADKLGVI